MDGSRGREHPGMRGWSQSNEETMASRLVPAPPVLGHRRTAGDEKSAAADMGVRHRRRWRRFRAHGLDSFGGQIEHSEAELPGTTVELGKA